MEGEKEIQKLKLPPIMLHIMWRASKKNLRAMSFLSGKALEDDFELDEDLDRLPI